MSFQFVARFIYIHQIRYSLGMESPLAQYSSARMIETRSQISELRPAIIRILSVLMGEIMRWRRTFIRFPTKSFITFNGARQAMQRNVVSKERLIRCFGDTP